MARGPDADVPDGGDPDAGEPVGLVRVRFIGGPLAGCVLDLPAEQTDPDPGRLLVTAEGGVYDRSRDCRAVAGARVVRQPFVNRAVRTIEPRPDTL